MTSTDRIEREVSIRAPRSRVWKAISDANEFGAWFNASIDGEFAPGAKLEGTITEPGWEGTPFELVVDRVEPEHHFSFRWHPYAVERSRDYSNEPMTLVAFDLTDDGKGGTTLRIVESGFDRIPIERREEARRMNGEGWAIQADRVARYVTR
jgi:uncharacterized protein YndB with AHSA1/START domain